jgi:flagellar hook protein FlgE
MSSSLNAGVAGLNANANRLSTISDNIANASTFGYKRVTSDFQSVVLHGDQSAAYSAGGVRSITQRLIDERGPLLATSNSTDLAMSGRGFIPVASIDAVKRGETSPPVSLATTGSFKPDADGYLRTGSGQVLMGWRANDDGTMGTFSRNAMSSLSPVKIDTNLLQANPTTGMALSANLPALATQSGGNGQTYTMSVPYYGNLGGQETLDYVFTPSVPAAGAAATNSWTMQISDSASGGAVIGTYALTFDGSQGSGGTLASVTPAVGSPAYTTATGTIALTTGGGSMSLSIGVIGEKGGMTQLETDFIPIGKASNGSPVGSLVAVEVDDSGFLHANYDHGFSKVVYQIPVVDVANPNGLASHSDQTYTVTMESGGFYLWDSGDGPTGTVVGNSMEQSTTDVTSELTSLISTQRAYSSNVKVIQTVDEMLQETANLKR